MADLNALIAQGYQFQAPPDPFAQYAKMQQLNVGQNQNALAQYQLAQAQRQDVQANALNQAYASGVNPDTGEMDYAKVRRSLAAGGAGSQIPALEKTRLEQQQAKLTQEKLLGEIAAQPVALAEAKIKVVDSQLKQSKDRLNQIDPYSPDAGQQLLAWHQSNHQGLLGDTLRASGSTPEQTQGSIQAAVAKGPAGIADFIQKSTLGQTEFAKSIAPIPEAATDGKTKFFIDKNPRSPTFGQKVGGAGFAMGMTPGETSTANTAASRLAFDQQKFAWEKANPSYELIQNADGEYYAVDKRTRALTPLMVGGGAAPAAAAPAAGAGRGSVGVTDGRAAPAAGVPFVGKSAGGTTEGERKAATLLQRLEFSQSQLTQALVDDPNAAKPGVLTSALAKLSTPLANTLTPEARQRVESAQLDMLDAALTLGTGAAYTKEQLEGYRSSYFPSVGDGPKQIKDKEARLKNVISAAQIAAGKAGKLVPKAPTVVPAAVSDDRAKADKILGE
jgi:hypothetical protein